MYQTGCVFVCTSADDNFNYRHLWKQSISLNQRKYILCLDLDLDSRAARGAWSGGYQMLWRRSEQRTEVMYLNYILLDTIHKSAAAEAGAVAENQAPLHRCCTDNFNTAANGSCITWCYSSLFWCCCCCFWCGNCCIVVAYTFAVETTSNQNRYNNATDTATSVSTDVDL